MALTLSIKTPEGSFAKIAELQPGQQAGSFVDLSQGKPRLIVFECAPDDNTSVIGEVERFRDRIVGTVRGIQDPKVRQLALLSHGESFELEVQKEMGSPRAPIQFLHQKTRLNPQDVILMMFAYFQRDTLSFSDIYLSAVAQVWDKPTPPPKDLMDKMLPSVRGVLNQMVASGQMTVEKRPDGQNHYSLIKGN